jgi:glutamyl-tRNA reductase
MIGVIGASYRCADLPVREAIAKALSSCDLPLMDRSVPLLTCNRAEWYFSTQTPAHTHQRIVSHIQSLAGTEAACHLYTFFGLECFRHLGRVVAGLDSLFVGETEIQGQVKNAYEDARKKTSLPPELHFLFQKSLRTGKVLRSGLRLPTDEGLCDQVLQMVVNHLHAVSESSALLVGTSMINRRLAKRLQERDVRVTYVNRTFERAQQAAEEIGGQALPWAELLTTWTFFPCVVAATRSSDYVLYPPRESPLIKDGGRICLNDLPPMLPLQLLIDLSIPRNIDPALATENRYIVNIDAFAPTQEAETTLFHRSRSDFSALATRSARPVSGDDEHTVDRGEIMSPLEAAHQSLRGESERC